MPEDLDKMMEEVSMVTSNDARAIEQMSEEEILACLVAEAGPAFRVRLIVDLFINWLVLKEPRVLITYQ